MERNEFFGLTTGEGQPVPLNKVDVRGTLVGRGARVKVTQVFENRESKPIEAVYKFPLPENSAICWFKIVVGDRITEGMVEERDKAFQLYDEALTRGDGGYLLDQERPNIFTLSVGNLNPGASASIEIEYVALLDAKGTEVRFFLPTTISPRYIPERTPDKGGIPVDNLVNPPISMEVPYHLSIHLEIHGKETISSIDSPSHSVSLKFDDKVIEAEFTSGAAAMDRDFILNINYKEPFQNRCYFCGDQRGGFYQLDLCPAESDGGKASDIQKEVIFVLDCSGSMQENSISEAKAALEIFLKALREGMRFNVYQFGSTYKKLSPESLPYNGGNLRNMLTQLKVIDANLGGTEVLAPLKEIYQSKVPAGYCREVILITDGEIGNESEVLELIKEGNEGTRLFTVGIGYGPNEYFIRQLTRVAGGTSELIAPGERIEPKMLRLFRQVMSERIDDLKINWDNENLQTEQAPFNPVMFAKEPTSIFARVKGSVNIPKEIDVSFRAGKGLTKLSIPVQEVMGDVAPVHVLWARERIRDLEEGTTEGLKKGSRQIERRDKQVRDEIIQLSREFMILSGETSFVAIEKRAGDEKTKGEVVLRKVPVMLTKGWGGMERVQKVSYQFKLMPAMTKMMEGSVSFHVRKRIGSLMLKEPPTKVTKTPVDDILMSILSSQKAEGGFEIDKNLSRLLGISMTDLRSASSKMELKEEADRSVFLSTAIILQVLKMYFAEKRLIWESLVEKTEKWFQREISRKEPRIEGIPLEDWALQFVKALQFQRRVTSGD